MPFHVIFDTNFFRGSANLRTQRYKGLKNLIQTAGGTVLVPSGVRLEILEGQRERLVEAKKKREQLVNTLRDIGAVVDVGEVEVEKHLAEYGTTFDNFIAEEDIQVLPFPKNVPSTEDLFKLASAKQIPFDAKGQSYRDAMISYSIKEFAASTEHPILFVSDDSDFRERIDVFLPGSNVKAVTPQEAQSALEGFLNEAQLAFREMIGKEIDSQLKGLGLANFEKFAKDAASFEYEPIGDTVISYDEFKATEFVGTDNLSIAKGKASFTAIINGDLTITVKTYGNRAEMMESALSRFLDKPRKVGDVVPHESEGTIVSYIYPTTPIHEKREIPYRLEIQCECAIDGKGKLSNLQFVAVTGVSYRLAEKISKAGQK